MPSMRICRLITSSTGVPAFPFSLPCTPHTTPALTAESLEWIFRWWATVVFRPRSTAWRCIRRNLHFRRRRERPAANWQQPRRHGLTTRAAWFAVFAFPRQPGGVAVFSSSVSFRGGRSWWCVSRRGYEASPCLAPFPTMGATALAIQNRYLSPQGQLVPSPRHSAHIQPWRSKYLWL